jgi:hypothetical protein
MRSRVIFNTGLIDHRNTILMESMDMVWLINLMEIFLTSKIFHLRTSENNVNIFLHFFPFCLNRLI